jgi:hypothetical protein
VNSARSLHVGGVCGYVTAKKGADTFASKLQSDVTVSLEEGETSYNYVGGLFGNISSLGACDITNAASYLTLDLDNEHNYWADNRFGAFGITLTANDVFSITNVFSKVTVDEINVNIHGYSAYTANAIIGEAFHGKQSDGTVVGGYEFNNLFGFVQQLDQTTGVREVQETLYHMPTHAIYMESNCRGCESLPTDSGFDTGIWELNDPSMPKIK